MQLTKKAAPLFVLASVFLLPTINRMMSLVEAGNVRTVDLATLIAGGFASGMLLCSAIGRWRAARAGS